MQEVSLDYAKEHLEELVARAAAGDVVRIATSDNQIISLSLDPQAAKAGERKPRRLGILEGKMTVPARLMEPMSEEELADWYGEER